MYFSSLSSCAAEEYCPVLSSEISSNCIYLLFVESSWKRCRHQHLLQKQQTYAGVTRVFEFYQVLKKEVSARLLPEGTGCVTVGKTFSFAESEIKKANGTSHRQTVKKPRTLKTKTIWIKILFNTIHKSEKGGYLWKRVPDRREILKC